MSAVLAIVFEWPRRTWARSSGEVAERPRRSEPSFARPPSARDTAPWWISKTEVDEPTVVVGVVTGVHGLRGDVSIQNRSDNADRWTPGGTVLREGGAALTIEASRHHGRRLIVKFAGIADRSAAEALRGAVLVVPESSLPPLAEGEWWAYQLEGCEVRTVSGRVLGIVREVIPNPANDLWVAVDEEGNETLVPALADLLVDVDVVARTIVVNDVPGLTAPEAPPEETED
jgi:16S rRNA processing protein RimM